MILSATAEKALNAYGGSELWHNSKYIEAEVSVKGLAFVLKRRPFFNRAKIFAEVHRPYSRLTPIADDSSVAGVLVGHDAHLENPQGESIAERREARQYFSSLRRMILWDDLDMAYFANYAFWNYFSLPALLMRTDILWKEIIPGSLEAKFPESIPTHSPFQQFMFNNQTGLLVQHNYTAEIMSRFAKAANVVIDHSENNGLVYPSVRRVTPRGLKGEPFKYPVLIDIEVHDFRLVN